MHSPARAKLVEDIATDMAALKRLILRQGESPTQHHISHARVGLLLILAHEGPQNLKALAGRLCMTPSAATQLTDALVDEKLVGRTQDKQDRRRITLTLTPVGKQKLLRTQKMRMATLAKLLKPLTDAELRQWHALQRKIVDHA